MMELLKTDSLPDGFSQEKFIFYGITKKGIAYRESMSPISWAVAQAFGFNGPSIARQLFDKDYGTYNEGYRYLI
jgi:hypothetical protein